MASGIRDLRVWQEAVALAGEVVRTLRPAARREVAPIITRIMTTAFDAAAAIADGYARHDPTEQRRRYAAARRELVKLDTDLAVARLADLLGAAPHAALTDRIQGVQRILAGYLVYLDRQLELPPGVTRLVPTQGAGGPGGTLIPRADVTSVSGASRLGTPGGSATGLPGTGGAPATLGPPPPPPPPPPAPSPGAAARMAVRESVDQVDGA
ncbi:MAG TPA: four helix bundle protein [Gemmatimonadaceae bacterium]